MRHGFKVVPYRDAARDMMTIPHSNPEKCRERIEQLLVGLVSKGFGDDALWLVTSIIEYIKETGDFSFADKILPYAEGGAGTVYEHMTGILDFSAEQAGESGAASLLHEVLGHFVELAKCLGRNEDAARYGEIAGKVRTAGEQDFRAVAQNNVFRHPLMAVTGSSAYLSATHYMLGVRPGFDELIVDPCIPADWKSFTVLRCWRGAVYDIFVENPDGVMKGVKEIYMNGEKLDMIPVMAKGTENQVRVVMG